ncbi:anti-sigma factor family protein [Parasphingorhabdus sp. NYA22]
MTFDEEKIIAYVDGECDAVTARRIEKAMATDGILAERIAREQALRSRLAAHYDPVAQEPVPDRLTALLTASMDSNVDNSFAGRKADEDRKTASQQGFGIAQWGAMAATLALGIVVGQFGLGQNGGPIAQQDGALIASGALENALERQLASAQSDDSSYRIGLTFRSQSNQICRSFDGESLAGIACKANDHWQLEDMIPGKATGGYRQASSSEINARAAAMMADAPEDADSERKLMEKGWK